MKGKVSAICPNCKYCEGMVEDSFYICGVTHSDGGLYHLMGVEDELYCTAYEEEINMNKVEDKVSDFCPKCKNCKNCKAVTRMHDGETASIRLTEVECEDPYDGMAKTLDADGDINVTDLLKDVKDLKIYAKENEMMYKEIQEWRGKCIARGKDIDHLLSENKEKDKKISELIQTVSDQEVTIKALLITIKEMCKEDETNE